jgi:serine/threonine protein phosphatase 1
MFLTLKKWFAPTPKLATRKIPRGQRVYAVGDVHGRVDLFRDLVDKIEADDAARGAANTTVILLGDLVDRGPDSAGVLDAAIELGTRRRVRTLCGNHEEMFLKSLESDGVLRDFLRRGGRETVLSYPIDEDTYNDLDFEQLRLELHRIVPERHLQFLRGLEDWIIVGDYLFVHAGIQPGVAIEDQSTQDLRWIREPFLSAPSSSDYCVVHGHTISEDPEERPGRIGVDTGAYMSGRLTAVGLEGDERWFLSSSSAT